ncbi:TetR/AcrR family transcriptional regulator [Streptomyces sp. NPDC055400]
MRADASRNRERILDAAREAIRDYGTNVPFNEVARRAGVGNATVYRHFTTRRELIHQVTLSSISMITDVAEQALADQADAFEALRHFMHRALDEGIGALCTLVTDNGNPTCPEVDQARTRLERAFETLMSQARVASCLRTDVAVDDLGMALAQLTRPLPGIMYVNFRQFAHRHLQLFLDGLSVPVEPTLPGAPP